MRHLSRGILIAIVAVIAIDATQAAQWAKSFVGLGYPASVQSVADGGYIAVGNSLAFNAWVIKLDANGEVSWQKTFDGMIGGAVHPTADGGFIVGGEVFSTARVGSTLLLKLDAGGNVIWQRTYSDSDANFNYTLEPTLDGGYIATGGRRGQGLSTIWVIKLSASADVAWQKKYVSTSEGEDDAITAARPTSDGGYILAGGTTSFGEGNGDAWLMRLSASGEVIWQKTYGGRFGDSFVWMQSTLDSGYIVAGSTTALGPRKKAWVLRLDADGNVIWQKAYGIDGLDAGVGSIRETPDGGFVMAGGMYSLEGGVSTAWVLKLDTSGEIVWQRGYGIDGPLSTGLVLVTPDGGYIVAGSSSLKDAWLLKLDANGAIPGCGMLRASNATANNTSATIGYSTASLSAGNASPTIVAVSPRDSTVTAATPCYYAGPGASVVEFYHAALDHYFITWMPNEIAILDAGTQIRGWTRTGYSFKTHTTPQAGTSPVCRYYIPPALGDSHFFGRGTAECSVTGQKNPTFVLEDPAFMQTFLPAAGVCPANATPVYRVFSNRLDANHRYMTDRTVRDQMIAKGWLAEGDGPDLVVMCAPQ